MRSLTAPAEAQPLVDSLKAAGADMIDLDDNRRQEYLALAAAARRAGLPLGGYAQNLTVREASDSGTRIFNHYVLFTKVREQFGEPRRTNCFSDSASVQECQAVADQFRRNDSWLVPGLYVAALADFGASARSGYVFTAPRVHPSGTLAQHLHRDIKAFLDTVALSTDSARARNWLRGTARLDPHGRMRVMQRVGLPLLAGTVAGGQAWEHWWLYTGFALHAELAMYVMEGLTPLAALQSATLNPAKFLHATDSLGTVAPGKLADLVLLDANPLADITNTTTIRAVVANGRYYDRAALDQVLREVRAEAKAELLARGRPEYWDEP